MCLILCIAVCYFDIFIVFFHSYHCIISVTYHLHIALFRLLQRMPDLLFAEGIQKIPDFVAMSACPLDCQVCDYVSFISSTLGLCPLNRRLLQPSLYIFNQEPVFDGCLVTISPAFKWPSLEHRFLRDFCQV